MDLSGKKINGFELVERVNGTGVADVYYATRKNSLNQLEEAAIKIVHNNDNSDPDYIERFMREMRILEEVVHDHIINVVDWGISPDEYPFLVTQWMGGLTSVRQIMKKRPFMLYDVYEVVRQVGHVLDHIHSLGVLHRDIKPDKIYTAGNPDEWHIYLGNFGLSKQIGIDLTLTATGTSVGTAQYMSPEMARTEPNIDHRSDLYSFAVMIYELLLGRPPFIEEGNYMLLVLAQDQTPPPKPTDLNPNFPPAIEAVLLKALAKERDARYQTAQEFVDAFIDAIQGMDETANFWVV